MNLRLALATGLCVLGAASFASAQEVTIGYQGLPYKSSGESNTGIQVGDGLLMHVGAGAEAGYDSNVFYDDTGVISSPLIRAALFAQLTNATRTGAAARNSFDLRAGLGYRHYQSDDPFVKDFSDAWLPTAGLAFATGGGQFGFGLADAFARLEDAPYAGGSRQAIIRYNNQASIEGRWSPGGGRLAGMLRYTNMVDVFQGDYSFATSDANYLMLDAAWKWLPKTAIFLNAQQGLIFYLNDAEATANRKSTSLPLLLTTGIRGLLTEKTSVVLALGYFNGFYSNGGSTGGFLGSSYLDLSFTFRPTMLSRIVLGGRHDTTNAVVSSFTSNETAYLSYVQQIAGRLALDLSGRYSHKKYGGAFADQGMAGRTDDYVTAGASLDYFVRNWVYAGVAYSMLLNSSNIATVEYVKHQMFVRLGITY
jgi:hypothetical protein